MKLQPASRKEITRITIGTLVCDGIMIAGLFLLSQFGIGQFDFFRIGGQPLGPGGCYCGHNYCHAVSDAAYGILCHPTSGNPLLR